jgi:hypothetical protein
MIRTRAPVALVSAQSCTALRLIATGKSKSLRPGRHHPARQESDQALSHVNGISP